MAPAMNPKMWSHPATRRNRKTLEKDGILFVGPNIGEMAESGEAGAGRMAEPLEIVAAIEAVLDTQPKPLAGKKIIVTSGPTHEPIDPVRYIANRSSGKQGHAIAAALARLGADVRSSPGPVTIPDPAGVKTVHVERAEEMRDAVEQLLPADAAVFVAAVADWRTDRFRRPEDQEGRRQGSAGAEDGRESRHPRRCRPSQEAPIPRCRLRRRNAGRAEERRSQAEEEGRGLHRRQRCQPGGVMGGDRNRVRIVSKSGVEEWPEMGKDEVAARLADLIAERLKTTAV